MLWMIMVTDEDFFLISTFIVEYFSYLVINRPLSYFSCKKTAMLIYLNMNVTILA